MPRFARWCLWVALFVLLPYSLAQDGKLRADDPPPNAETIKRLAQQLQGSQQLPNDIDPELLKLAQKYLEKNPDILKDPNFQEQVKQWQQQAKSDPQGLVDKFKEQNPKLTPNQLDTLKKQFQQGNGNGFKPPPNIGQPPTPPRPPEIQNPPPTPPGLDQPSPKPPPPMAGTPPFQPNTQPFDNFGKLPLPNPADKAQASEGYQQTVAFWENNFGSIENTPELKKSLIDMFSGEGKSPWDGGGNGNPWNPNGGNGNGGGNSPWNNPNGSNDPNQSGFVNWLKNSTSNGPPTWWKNMTNWNKSAAPPPNMGSGWKPPQPSGLGGGGGGGFGDLSSGAWPAAIFVLVIVLAVAAFVAWRYWPQIQSKLLNKPKAVAGLGPWTIDPRDVKDRETLVKAFEYLSVLVCGDGARVWNHLTIADAFRQHVPGAAPFADPLARLYALARYSPANEAIDPADIAEARGYLCRLAEVQG